jgi:hypothetical protein
MARQKPSSIMPASSSRSGWDLEVSLYNYSETKVLMKSVDPELRKAMDKTIKALLNPIAKRAKSLVPEQPLSGWNYGDAGERYMPGRLPFWNPALAKRGIAVRQGGKRSKGSATQAAWKITNSSAPGAAFETAGFGPSKTAFIDAIQKTHTSKPRLIWRAWDEAGGDATVSTKVVATIKEYESLLQTQLNALS